MKASLASGLGCLVLACHTPFSVSLARYEGFGKPVAKGRDGGEAGRMVRYKIIQGGDGSFVVRISDDGDWSRVSPISATEAEAEAWVFAKGATEYTLTRGRH
jgi:hypothetical protein